MAACEVFAWRLATPAQVAWTGVLPFATGFLLVCVWACNYHSADFQVLTSPAGWNQQCECLLQQATKS